MSRLNLGILLFTVADLSQACLKPPAEPDGSADVKDASTILVDSSMFIVDASFDGRTATMCERACQNLKVLGCAEGLSPRCSATCEHVQEERIIALHPECLAYAATKTIARSCSRSIACP